MKLVKIAQMILLGFCIIALNACTHSRASKVGYNSNPNFAQPINEVQATGIGERENFGDSSTGPGNSSRAAAKKRTYYFDYDSNVVHEQDKSAIFANADYLIAHPNVHIILEGHTDPRGSREYNVALGERRAKAVAELLDSRGVNPRQIRIVSYGAERLAQPGHNEGAYRLDRRAIIVYRQN